MVGRIYYLLDPITEKIRYIGQTRLTIERRLQLHWLHRKQGKNKNNHAANWINKLWEQYKKRPLVFLIEEKICTDEELNILEINYIKKYLEKGFDLTNTSYNYYYRQREYKKFINGKKVYCYDKQYNEYIFINGRHAEKETGISYKDISRIALGNRCNKILTFSYTPLNNKEINDKFSVKHKKGIKIIAKNIETGNEITFNNQQEAASLLNINFRNINQCLKKIRKSCAGYLWNYNIDNIKWEHYEKKLLDLKTGLIYNNVKECAEKLNIKYDTIISNINYCKAKKFKYITINKFENE